jgi:hypothetical protein
MRTHERILLKVPDGNQTCDSEEQVNHLAMDAPFQNQSGQIIMGFCLLITNLYMCLEDFHFIISSVHDLTIEISHINKK